MKKPIFYLVFDVETTGVKASDNIVQLAAILSDDQGKELDRMNCIIAPTDFVISKQNSQIHGITQQIAQDKGMERITVLLLFLELVTRADVLVAHNLKFDFRFVCGALEKLDLLDREAARKLLRMESVCTMKTTTHFTGIPQGKGYKWPKLNELYSKLFGTGFEGAHNAIVDVEATLKCFFELKSKHQFYRY